MNSSLQPYPSMRNSGVEWLGKVPGHWDIKKLRSVLHSVTARNRPDLPLLSVVREKGVIMRDISSKEANHNFIPDDLTNYKVVRKDQFAMNKMKAWQGSYGISSHYGIVSPAYYVFDLEGVAHRFFNSAIRSKAYVPFFTQASDGVRIGQWDLSQARMREIPFAVPTVSEQDAIVRFIDCVDRRIRRYIRAKRKLIKLLEEQKQAIIHRAVTRGLDPNVPLKDSGVEWLGEVPEHWCVWPLGRFCRIGNGSTPSRGNPAYWANGSYPWLNSSSANQDTIKRADQFVTEIALKECHLPIAAPGSVLVAITGQGKTRGKAALLNMEATINQHLAFITPKPLLASGSYLQLIFESAYSYLRSLSDDSGSTRGALTCGGLKRFRVILPGISEQTSIVAHCAQATADINSAIKHTNREIELFNEYRTRLISDVVTGKLDVREAAASLPDEAEAPDETDELLPGIDETELDALFEEALDE